MIPGSQRRLRRFFSQYESAYGNSASQRLCAGHDIRLHTVRLPCKISARTSHAALDLIEDQDNVFLITDFAESFKEAPFCRVDSSLALYGFCDNGAGFLCDLGFHTVQIVKISELHPADQRLEGFPVVFVSRNRKGSHASAVEGMIHGDDLIPLLFPLCISIFSGGFQGALNGLRTAVGKKRLAHAAGFHQFFSGLAHGLVVIQIRDVKEFVDLGFQRLIISRIMISQGVYGDSRREIQIFFSFRIVKPASLPVIQNHGKAVIGMENAFLRLLHLFIHVHCNIFRRPLLRLPFRFLCL